MNNYRCFIQHWIFTLITAIGLFWSWDKGFLQLILESDVSRMCIVNFVAMISVIVLLGYGSLVYQTKTLLVRKLVDLAWFVAALAPQIGLLGTVVGLMTLFSATNFDLSNPDAVHATMSVVFTGMKTIFLTTFTGVLVGIVLKNFTYHLEQFLVDHEYI